MTDVSSPSEVLHGRRPPVFDGRGAGAALLLLGSALLWAGALWRESSAPSPVDPPAMALRLAAITVTLRCLLELLELMRRLRVWGQARQHRLTVDTDALIWKSPSGTRRIERDELLDIVEPGMWGSRRGRRYTDLFLLVQPQAGRAIVRLPPVFDDSPGVLAERLMRWRGPPPERRRTFPRPARLASKVYDAAAEGRIPPGSAVLRHGWGWLRRGPYVALLFGIVFFDASRRLPEGVSLGLLPVVGLAACLLVPLGWLILTRRQVAPRKGLAMVLTPAEVLMRTRQGILRASWPRVTGLRIDTRRGWSVLEGRHAVRRLVIERENNPPIRYDEAYLGIPADVALALLEAYRKGWVTSPEASPSSAQGSGGGGGISDSSGATTTATSPTSPPMLHRVRSAGTATCVDPRTS